MAGHLGVVLSGRGYLPHAPVLHYPRLALQELGAEVRAVVNPITDGHLSEGEQWQAFFTGVAEQVAAMVADVEPERVTFVAKSLGTIALAQITLDLPATIAAVDAVWLTPLFGQDDVRDGAIARGFRSLLVAGDADPYHDPAGHEAVRAALAAESLVLHGADHSLEIEGDALATVDTHRRLVERVLGFLDG